MQRTSAVIGFPLHWWVPGRENKYELSSAKAVSATYHEFIAITFFREIHSCYNCLFFMSINLSIKLKQIWKGKEDNKRRAVWVEGWTFFPQSFEDSVSIQNTKSLCKHDTQAALCRWHTWIREKFQLHKQGLILTQTYAPWKKKGHLRSTSLAIQTPAKGLFSQPFCENLNTFCSVHINLTELLLLRITLLPFQIFNWLNSDFLKVTSLCNFNST